MACHALDMPLRHGWGLNLVVQCPYLSRVHPSRHDRPAVSYSKTCQPDDNRSTNASNKRGPSLALKQLVCVPSIKLKHKTSHSLLSGRAILFNHLIFFFFKQGKGRSGRLDLELPFVCLCRALVSETFCSLWAAVIQE